MAVEGPGALRRPAGDGLRRVPPPPVRAGDAADEVRGHRVFVFACVGLVFASVVAVPAVFLRARPAPAAAGGPTVELETRAAEAAGFPAAALPVPRALTEADLNAVGDEEEEGPAPLPPPPPQTMSDACRKIPGYGTIFVEPQEGEEGVRVLEGKFGRRTFFQVVKEAGANLEAVQAISDAVKRTGLFDFRRIQPDDRYRLFVDADGDVRMFELARSDTDVYHAVRVGEASYVAHQVDVPVEQRVTRVAGRVEGSLARSLGAAGLDASIGSLLTDIFTYSVNFSRDARSGDRFRLAVEEQWIGGRFRKYTRVLAFEYYGSIVGAVRAYAFDLDGKTRYFAADGSSVQRVFLSAPCAYEAISSRFDPNRMHPILHRRRPHEGIDLVAPTGTPVYAIADGTLAFHGEKGPNGNLVVVEHAGGMFSYYAHLSAYAPRLRDGVAVRRGQLVGYVGSTGRSTGPHLHFGIKVDGEFVDPESYIKSRRAQPVPADRMAEFQELVAQVDRELASVALPDGPAPAAAAPLPAPEVGRVGAADAAP
ncbi:MAG: M23 family metallopeptidase [Deltaproteobacteria bacterium]|nr:M23 family metallopeptidase [Deltaproteobacteria bacterium]